MSGVHEAHQGAGSLRGRQAKYVDLLRRVALPMGVSSTKAKRRNIEDLLSRLSDYEIVFREKVIDREARVS